MTVLPLEGKRVLVTRAAHQAGKLSEGLRVLGATPVAVPVLEICPPANFDPLDRALRSLGSYDWLILTSTNTVRAFEERSALLGISLAGNATPKVAAIGSSTAAAAEKAGLKPSFIPDSYVAESLVEGLAKHELGRRVLLVRAETARDVIPDALRVMRVEVEVVDAYRNAVPAAAPEKLREALGGRIDAATFTSSSSVSHLAKVAKLAGLNWPFHDVAAISIGPITSESLRDAGWPPAAEANPSDIPGLIAAVAAFLAATVQR